MEGCLSRRRKEPDLSWYGLEVGLEEGRKPRVKETKSKAGIRHPRERPCLGWRQIG